MIEQLEHLEWEITTACNAACPQCPRNYYGGRTWDNLPIVQNNLVWAQQYLPIDIIKQLKRIDFCGTYGDPIMNNDLIDIVQWLRQINPELKVTVKTNGSLRDTDWWSRLASALGTNGGVFFGIDGLRDTNHLYRRRTNFDKIIENALSFIKSGGVAHWNYIVFRHNEHQVDDARRLSKELGFSTFNVKLTGRFLNKNHKMVDNIWVYSDQNQPEYQIEIPRNPKYVNSAYNTVRSDHKNIFINNKCLVKDNKLYLYLSAEGYVFPCGWLHDRMYGYETEQNTDHQKLEDFFKLAGGKHKANITCTPIEDIVDGAWFKTIIDSWRDHSSALERCQIMCGRYGDLIPNQNKLVEEF